MPDNKSKLLLAGQKFPELGITEDNVNEFLSDTSRLGLVYERIVENSPLFANKVAKEDFINGYYTPPVKKKELSEPTRATSSVSKPLATSAPLLGEEKPKPIELQPPTQASDRDATSVQAPTLLTSPSFRKANINFAAEEVTNLMPSKEQVEGRLAMNVFPIKQKISSLNPETTTQEEAFQLNQELQDVIKQSNFGLTQDEIVSLGNTLKPIFPDKEFYTFNENGEIQVNQELLSSIPELLKQRDEMNKQEEDAYKSLVEEYKEYTPLGRNLMRFVNSANDLFYGTVIQNSLSLLGLDETELSTAISDLLESNEINTLALKQATGATLEQIEKGVTATALENPMVALNMFGQEIASQIPIMLGIALAPEFNIYKPTTFAAANTSSLEALKAVARTKASQLGSKSNSFILALGADEAKRGYEEGIERGLSPTTATLVGTAKGLATYFGEHLFMEAPDALRAALKGEAAKQSKSVRQLMIDALDQFAKEGVLEEGVINLSSQMIDAMVYNEEFNVYSFLDESLIGGAVGSGAMVSGAAIQKAGELISTRMTNKRLREVGGKIDALVKKMTTDELTPSEEASLKSSIRFLQSEYKKEQERVTKLVSRLDENEAKQLIELQRDVLNDLDTYNTLDNKEQKDALKSVIQAKAAAISTLYNKANDMPDIEVQESSEITSINQELIIDAVNSLADDETRIFTFESRDAIPEPLRDRATERKTTRVQTFHGRGLKGLFNQLLGIGETKKVEVGTDLFQVAVTGKELRDIVESQDTPLEEQVSEDVALQKSTTPEMVQANSVLDNKEKFNNVVELSSKNSPINEVVLDEALNEAYTALFELENNTTEDAAIMRELIEDEIQKLENYDNTTTTETRKIAEERTRRISKKTPRKTIPRKEKEFVGKKAKYRDNKGGGGSGVITIVETPDGKEYYVLKGAEDSVYEVIGATTTGEKVNRVVEKTDDLTQAYVLGETSKAFKNGVVNFDKNGNAVSVTFEMPDGKQTTITDPEIAEQVIQEQTIQQEFDEQVFEDVYIEFVGEEKVEVKKPNKQQNERQETDRQEVLGENNFINLLLNDEKSLSLLGIKKVPC